MQLGCARPVVDPAREFMWELKEWTIRQPNS